MDLKKIEIKTDKDEFKNVIVIYSIYGETAEVKLQSGFQNTRIKETLIYELNEAITKYFSAIRRRNSFKQLDLFGEEHKSSFINGLEYDKLSLKNCLKEDDDRLADVKMEPAELPGQYYEEKEGDSDVGNSEEV